MVSPSLGAANWRSSLMNWSGRVGAAVVMMTVCGAASRVVFGFLY